MQTNLRSPLIYFKLVDFINTHVLFRGVRWLEARLLTTGFVTLALRFVRIPPVCLVFHHTWLNHTPLRMSSSNRDSRSRSVNDLKTEIM